MTGTMGPMEGANWAVETWVAPTDSVACWCFWPHVGVMAAHGVSQAGFLPPPTPLYSAAHPTHPLLAILTIRNLRWGKKYHEIQPSEIKKACYNR